MSGGASGANANDAERGEGGAVQAAISATFKILGEFSDGSGAGVLGRNTADSGTPIGVEGTVPNSAAGYGLATPDDARVEGTLETGRIDTAGADIGTTESPFVQVPTDYGRHHEVASVGHQYESWGDLAANDWTAQSGSHTADGNVVYHGSQSVYLETAGDGQVFFTNGTPFDPPLDVSGLDWSLALRLEYSERGFYPRVRFVDGSGNRRYLRSALDTRATDRWTRHDLGHGQADDSGFDPTDVVHVEVIENDPDARFWIDDLRAVERPDKAYLMFSFDDANETDYTVAFPTLGEYGHVGTCFVPTDNFGTAGSPSEQQYREMQERGWIVGSHTQGHEDLPNHGREQQRRILAASRRDLVERGFVRGARFFRTTYSNYDTDTLDLMPEYYELSFVGAGPVDSTNLRITDPRTIGFQGGDDYQAAKGMIDDAVATNRLLGLTLHGIDDQAGFEDLVQHAHDYVEAGDLEIITPATLLDNLRTLHAPF